MALDFDSRLVRSAEIRWRMIDGETLLLDPYERELIRLNAVGAEIWGSIDGRRTVGEIVEHVQATFEVSKKRAARDVRGFLKRLHRCELVEEAEEA